jgi:hypothetical protein
MDPSILAVTPAGTPPPGVTPDFVNGERFARHWYQIAMATCIVVSTVVVALRLFARVVVIKRVDWSDCMAPPACDDDQDAFSGYWFADYWLFVDLALLGYVRNV